MEYFAGSKGNSAIQTVSRQAARAEAGHAKGQIAVTVLWDVVKYYESISLPRLLEPGARLGFPMQILRVRINMYRGCRHIQMRNTIKGPYYASRGITAGCPFATTFTRVYTIQPLDTLRLPPTTQLALYLDDSGTSRKDRRA